MVTQPMLQVSPEPPLRRSNSLHVCWVDPSADPRWERFVSSHPDALIYHHPAWIRALEKESRRECLGLACEDSFGTLQAVLPLFRTRGFPFGLGGRLTSSRLSSLPRTPLAGPLSMNRDATVRLLRAAMKLVDEEPGIQLQIKSENDELEGLVDGLVCLPWRMSYVLELPDSPDKIRFGGHENHHRVKWAVNKAQRSGLKVRITESEDDLRAWYAMYLDRMRYNLVPPRSYRFFSALWQLLKPRDLMHLMVAEHQTPEGTRLVAGSIFLLQGRRFFYAYTGSRAIDFGFHPNDLLQWEAIHEACRRGCHLYDFGEVPEEHQQLAQFKAKWCAEPKRLFHYCYPVTKSERQAASIPNFWGRKTATVIWRQVPLPVTVLAGDWVYKFL